MARDWFQVRATSRCASGTRCRYKNGGREPRKRNCRKLLVRPSRPRADMVFFVVSHRARRPGSQGIFMTADSSAQVILLNRLAEEYAERYRRGERPPLQDYIDRHPELADDIREFFPAMAEMEQAKEDRDDESKPDAAGPLPPLERLGDFRIIREIGHGGMGVVYEAEQVSLGRHVALKVLPRQLLIDSRMKRRFEREAKAAAKLHHTNIVPVFGVGEHDGLPYYVMQFIQGTGLHIVINDLARLGPG